MSTKSSVAFGDKFHLYEEIFEDDVLYLRFDRVDSVALEARVGCETTVTICLRKSDMNALIDQLKDVKT